MKALSLSCLLCLLVVASVAAEPAPVAPAPPRLDDFGDALPPNAVARIGSTRLRHGGSIFALSVSPDGTQLFSAGWDQMVRIWDTATGKEINSFFIKDLNGVEFAVDGQTMVVSQYQGGETLWSMAGRPLARLIAAGRDFHGDRVWYHGDGKHLVTVVDGVVTYWDLVGPRKIHTFEAKGKMWTQAWGDGKHLATKQSDGEIQLWDVATGKQDARLTDAKGESKIDRSFTVSPDGRYVVTQGHGVWELATGKTICAPAGDDFTFAANGLILASKAWNSRGVRLWDLASGKMLRELTAPEGLRDCVAFSRDGSRLATSSYTGAIRIWDVGTGKQTVPLAGREAGSLVGLINAGGTILVQNHGHLRSWDLENRNKHEHIRFPRERPRRIQGVDNTLALSKDGGIALVVNSHRGLFLMDLGRDKELHMLTETSMGESFWDCNAAFAPDGKTVACGTSFEGDSIVAWDVATGKVKWEEPGERNHCTMALAFSQDSKTLVSVGSGDGHQVRFLDAATGRELHQGQTPGGRHYERPRRMPAYSPRGTVLGIFTDKDLQLWDPAVPCAVQTLPGVGAFAFSPDGQVLATAGREWGDATIRLWEVGTGRPFAALRGSRSLAKRLIFTPDGQGLVTGSDDGTVLVWDIRLQNVAAGVGKSRPNAAALTRAWAALAASDATTAHQAMGLLLRFPAASLPFLRQQFPPTATPPPAPSRLCSASWTPMHSRTAKRPTRNYRSSTGLWNPSCARPWAKSRTSTCGVTWNDCSRIWRARTWASHPATACGHCAVRVLEAMPGPDARQDLDALAARCRESHRDRSRRGRAGATERNRAPPGRQSTTRSTMKSQTRRSRSVAFRSAKGRPFAERKATLLRCPTSRHVAEILLLPCLLCLLLVAPAAAQPAPVAPPPPRLDDFGDPLPPNAMARIGSTRLRHGGRFTAVSLGGEGSGVRGSLRPCLGRWARKAVPRGRGLEFRL